MKKNLKVAKKLSLNTQTVRMLASDKLARVQGGLAEPPTWGDACTWAGGGICPDVSDCCCTTGC